MAIPQRICFVVTSPFTIRVFMLRHLEALAARYDVTIIFNPAESPGIPLHFDSRIHLVELDINRRISLWNDLGGFISLLRIFRRERFFVVHTITPKAGLLGQIAAWMGRVPFRVHTFTGQVWVTRQGIFRFILKMVDKLYAACATHVLVDSPSQRDFLVEQGILPDGRGLSMSRDLLLTHYPGRKFAGNWGSPKMPYCFSTLDGSSATRGYWILPRPFLNMRSTTRIPGG